MIANEYFTPTPMTILRILPPTPKKGDFGSEVQWSSRRHKNRNIRPTFFGASEAPSEALQSWWRGFRLKTLESVETYIRLMVNRPENQLRLVVYLPLFTGFQKHPNGGWPWDFWSINIHQLTTNRVTLDFCSDLQCLWAFNFLYWNTWSVDAALFGSHSWRRIQAAWS